MAKKRSDPEFRRIVFDKFNGQCAYCGCFLENRFHIDHVIPKRRGSNYIHHTNFNKIKGRDTIENYMPSCASCNISKSDLTIDEFRKRVEDRIVRLNKYSTEYNIAKRFGLVLELNTAVIFYFEKFHTQCQELEA